MLSMIDPWMGLQAGTLGESLSKPRPVSCAPRMVKVKGIQVSGVSNRFFFSFLHKSDCFALRSRVPNHVVFPRRPEDHYPP